jgi:hypothetical protein
MKKFLLALGLTVALSASAEDAVVSGGIPEIVKLSKSGVAPSVVEQYINSSQFPFKTSVDDVLYLHKEGVPDEIITALMKRGEEIRRAQIAFHAAELPMRAPAPVAQPQAIDQTSGQVPIPSAAPAYYSPAPQPMVYAPPVPATYVAPYPYPAYPYYPNYYGYAYGPGYYPGISVGFGFPFRGGFGFHGGFHGHR